MGNFPIDSQRLIARTLVEDIVRSLPDKASHSSNGSELRRSLSSPSGPKDSDDQNMLLSTTAHVRWALKGIAPIFCLNMEDADSISNAVSLYAKWMGLFGGETGAMLGFEMPSCIDNEELKQGMVKV